MVLNHSRQIFLRFFPDARMESFLRGHAAAFTACDGVPRILLFDNLSLNWRCWNGAATRSALIAYLALKPTLLWSIVPRFPRWSRDTVNRSISLCTGDRPNGLGHC
jgi:hypothetical protein